MPASNINHVALTGRLTSDPDLRVVARTVQFLDSPPSGGNGVAADGAGALQGFAAEEEESLDIADQDAVAALAAAG
jgi:hypothetical protein